jgi:diadenosine tetraphosphate (Ap4A) HIT family hydrolase
MPDPDPAADWSRRLAGDNCRYCPPRLRLHHRHLQVAPLTASTLYLNRDQRFRGYCLLVFDGGHVTALDSLTPTAYTAFHDDLRRASAVLRAALQPDHLNVECLGNQTPHLHWHLVPRFLDDPRWGYPIWDGQPFEPRQVDVPEPALLALRANLRARLAAAA